MNGRQHLQLETSMQFRSLIADEKEQPIIQEEFVQVGEHRIFTINTRPMKNCTRNCTVVLLHNQINDSSEWFETQTLQTLAQNNYSAIALDLPLRGRSSGPSLVTPEQRAKFLMKFLEVRNLLGERILLVGSSMAGQFLIPLLNATADRVGVRIAGVVGVGLSDAQELNPQVTMPKTLLIRGELDTSIGLNAVNTWKRYENVRQFVMPSGKHLCHINNAELFNNILIEFFNSITS